MESQPSGYVPRECVGTVVCKKFTHKDTVTPHTNDTGNGDLTLTIDQLSDPDLGFGS
jgi:hypothetical protein